MQDLDGMSEPFVPADADRPSHLLTGMSADELENLATLALALAQALRVIEAHETGECHWPCPF